MSLCQVVATPPLSCPATESGGRQCERSDRHGDDGHFISEHTIRHALLGNGYHCEAISPAPA